MSPYSIAATAAERVKRSAQLPPAARLAYARRVAFRALRASNPYLTAAHAWFVARSAANAHTAAYFTA
jgi:hypothetical protein